MVRITLLAALALPSVGALQAQPTTGRSAGTVEATVQGAHVVLDFGSGDGARAAEGLGVALRLGYRPAVLRSRLTVEAFYVGVSRSARDRRPALTLAGGTAVWAAAPPEGHSWRPSLLAAVGLGVLRLDAGRLPDPCVVTTPCFNEYHDFADEQRLVASAGVGALLPVGGRVAVRADLRGHRALGDGTRNRFSARTRPELAAGVAYRF